MRTLLPLLALSACTIETEPRNVPGPTEPAPVTAPPDRPDLPVPPAPTACDDDALEPNDNVAVEAYGVFDDLNLSTWDVDRFAITLAPGEELWAEAWFDNRDGNLDLYITTVDGVILDFSTTDDDQEAVAYLNEASAPIDLIVETNLYDAPDNTCAPYGLEIGVVEVVPVPTPPPPTPVCYDDASEPNQTWATATELLPAVDSDTVFDMVSNDLDWLYLVTTPDEEIEIFIRHDTPGTQLDVILSDDLGELGAGIAQSGTDLSFVVPATASGRTLDLSIAPFAANTCAPYIIEVRSYLLVCEEDLLEPNDVDAVYASSPAALTLFEGDVDRIAIDLAPGEELFVDAFFDNTYGNVDLELFDAAGVAVDWSTSNTDDEALTFFNDSPFVAELTVEVTLFDADLYTCQDVTLDWIIYGAVCVDDTMEENDYMDEALEMVPQLGQSVFYDLVANDDDWFWIQTYPGEVVDIFIEHGTLGADLDITAFDAIGQVDYAMADFANIEAGIALPSTVTGDLYDIQVRPISGPATCVPYTVTVVSY